MKNKFINKFVEWQNKKHSYWKKALVIILTPPFFLLFILSPGLLLSEKADKIISVQMLAYPINIYLGIPTFILGLTLFLWTILLFFKIGKGTQMPLLPTQNLITTGPFAYSRNPMALGVILSVIGLGIFFNSFSFIAIDLIMPILYLSYIKLVEEKELTARFGLAYLKYKKSVAFLIPHFRRKHL